MVQFSTIAILSTLLLEQNPLDVHFVGLNATSAFAAWSLYETLGLLTTYIHYVPKYPSSPRDSHFPEVSTNHLRMYEAITALAVDILVGSKALCEVEKRVPWNSGKEGKLGLALIPIRGGANLMLVQLFGAHIFIETPEKQSILEIVS